MGRDWVFYSGGNLQRTLLLTGKVGVQPGPTVLTDLNQSAGVCTPLTWEASVSPERGACRATPATGACVTCPPEAGGWWDICSLISNTVTYSHTQLDITLRQTPSYSVFNQSKWCRPPHVWRGSHARWDERRLQPGKIMTIIYLKKKIKKRRRKLKLGPFFFI